MAILIFPYVPFILFYGIAIAICLQKKQDFPAPAKWTMVAFGLMLFRVMAAIMLYATAASGFGGRFLYEISFWIGAYWRELSTGLLLGSLVAILVAIFGDRASGSPAGASQPTTP